MMTLQKNTMKITKLAAVIYKQNNKMKKAIFLAFTLVLILPASHARMYQWEQPQSGVIQLSGVAPAWYRSVHPGPQVLVFDNGRLVDDTNVTVSNPHRIVLRQKAMGEHASKEAMTAAEPEITPDQALKNSLAEAAKAGINIEELAAEALQAAEAESPPTVTTVQATVDELKALLARWDIAKSSDARSLLNTGGQADAALENPRQKTAR